MSRAQDYITSLLGRLPKWRLDNEDQQSSLEKIKNRLSAAPDIHTELKTLFKVNNYSDFALSLLWIADKVEKDPSRGDSTPDEESLVFSALKKAMSGVAAIPPQAAAELPASPEETAASGLGPLLSAALSSTESSADTTPAASLPSTGASEASTATPAAGGGGDERLFSSLLEKFVEAVQSGAEERTTLLHQVVNECKGISVREGLDVDFKQFCTLLVDFLQYITANQFLDDVRVMNILANIQDPFSQWANADPSGRAGLLDQGIDVLQNFKTMFE